MAQKIDIGKAIHEEMEKQSISVSFMAQKLNTNRRRIYRIFGKQSIDTDVLLQICIILEHDFFKLYSETFAKEHKA